MKLNDVRPNVETSDGMAEKFFSIQDLGMIFDILRNKMYSNPILAICREISCNARDAHREAGKIDEPIQITLPNSLEPFYKIKDWGIGISPDRMENIFIKYTASTKRNDNLQTGGFGTGSKTPFSYSDTFTIETKVNGIQYNYACYIDESKVGKLAPLEKVPTDDCNGTEIIIPVKAQDFKFFKEHTEFVCRHWDVKPIIKGDKIEFKQIIPTISGNGWLITKPGGDHYSSREMKLLVDGIEYPLDIAQLKGYANTKLLDALYGIIYLHFGVGELSLSASREAIHLDKNTQAKISKKIDAVVADLKKSVCDKIETFSNFWDANVYLNTELKNTMSNVDIFGTLTWKKIPLHKQNQYIDEFATVHEFTKSCKHTRYGAPPPNKIYKSLVNRVQFKNKTCIYLNDLGIEELAIKNVSKAFQDDGLLETVQVFSLKDGFTWSDLNKKYNIDQMAPKNLSAITKVSKTYNVSGVRLIIFKYDAIAKNFKQVSYANMEEDTNQKCISMLARDSYNASSKRIVLKNGMNLTSDLVNYLLHSNPKVSIYGVDNTLPVEKIEEHFSDFISIDKCIDDTITHNNSTDYVELKWAMNNGYSGKELKQLEKLKKGIKDVNSEYRKITELQLKILNIRNGDKYKLAFFERIKGAITEVEIKNYIKNHPENDFEAQEKIIEKKYPLLTTISYYDYDRVIDDIIHYINLIDKN